MRVTLAYDYCTDTMLYITADYIYFFFFSFLSFFLFFSARAETAIVRHVGLHTAGLYVCVYMEKARGKILEAVE